VRWSTTCGRGTSRDGKQVTVTVTARVGPVEQEEPPPGAAQASDSRTITVYSLDIKAADGQSEPPECVRKGDSVVLRAVVEPPIAGQYYWQAQSQKISIPMPWAETVTVNGVEVSESVGGETVSVDFWPVGEAPEIAHRSHDLTVFDVRIRQDGADGRVVEHFCSVCGMPVTVQATFNVKRPTATMEDR